MLFFFLLRGSLARYCARRLYCVSFACGPNEALRGDLWPRDGAQCPAPTPPHRCYNPATILYTKLRPNIEREQFYTRTMK